MYNIIYIIFVFYIMKIIAERKIDFLTFYSIGVIYYTFMCAFGNTYITGHQGFYYNSRISSSTYLIIYGQLILLIIFLKFCKPISCPKHQMLEISVSNARLELYRTNMIYSVIAFSSLVIMIYELVIKIGLTVFFSEISKGEINNRADTLMSISIWFALFAWGYAITNNKIKIAIMCLTTLLITLVLGTRAYILTAFIILLICMVEKENKKVYIQKSVRYIKQNFKYGFIIGAVAIFLVLYKSIYKLIRSLNFSKAGEVLLETLTSGIKNIGVDIEGRNVFSILSYTIDNNIRISFNDSMARLLSIFPYVNNYFTTERPLRYSEIMKNEVFNSSYGLASNIWGELYAIGGILALYLGQLIIMVFLNRSKTFIRRKKTTDYIWIALAAYLSFYITRLDIVQVFGSLKSGILAYFLFYFIYLCFKGKIVWNQQTRKNI